MQIFSDSLGTPYVVCLGDPAIAHVTAAILREARERPEKLAQRLRDPFRCAEIFSLLCGAPSGELIGESDVRTQAVEALLAEMATHAPDDAGIAAAINLARQPQEPGAWAHSTPHPAKTDWPSSPDRAEAEYPGPPIRAEARYASSAEAIAEFDRITGSGRSVMTEWR